MPKQTLKLPDAMRDIPKRVAERMAEMGINGKELATKTGHAPSRISDLLAGKKLDGLSAAVAIRVALALRVRIGWLLVGDEPKLATPREESGAEHIARVLARMAAVEQEIADLRVRGRPAELDTSADVPKRTVRPRRRL